jgi:hypothetical protein
MLTDLIMPILDGTVNHSSTGEDQRASHHHRGKRTPVNRDILLPCWRKRERRVRRIPAGNGSLIAQWANIVRLAYQADQPAKLARRGVRGELIHDLQFDVQVVTKPGETEALVEPAARATQIERL